jgi:hypothetical protein
MARRLRCPSCGGPTANKVTNSISGEQFAATCAACQRLENERAHETVARLARQCGTGRLPTSPMLQTFPAPPIDHTIIHGDLVTIVPKTPYEQLADYFMRHPTVLNPLDVVQKVMRKHEVGEGENPRTTGFDIMLRVRDYLTYGPPSDPGASTFLFALAQLLEEEPW